jgi:hypothetical protein
MNRRVSSKSINESAKELNGESKKKNLRDASLQIGTSNRNIVISTYPLLTGSQRTSRVRKYK